MQNDDNTQSFVQLTAGTRVAHYQIISKIGAGGMGEVYLAHDTKLDRKVALKFLSFHLSQDETSRARFTREAKAAAKLDHPNIVPVHEVGEYQGRPFFAMAHIAGQSLREVIKQGKLSVQGAIDYCMQICEGLNEAHSAGIVHRDIKPGNIIIDTKNKPRLLDFGLATLSGEEKLTKTGSTLGTVGYMSPEQITGKDVDQRSDIFSIGVILYEMLTGRRPFVGDTDAAVARSITDETPEPVSRYKSGVPDGIQQIVDKLLEKDARTRYQTAADVGADLIREKRMLDSGDISSASRSISGFRRTQKSGLKKWILSGEAVAAENRLAVMYFDNLVDPTDSTRLGEIVTNLLITDLSGSKYLRVVSSQRMYDILRQLGKEGSRNIDRETASQVAQKAGATWMLTGTILQMQPKVVITTQIIEVSSGQLEASQRSVAVNNEDIFAQVDKLSAEIRNDLDIPELAGEPTDKKLSEVTTNSPEAYRYYLEGMDYIRKYYTRKGRESYQKAIELDSTFAMAYFRLAMTWILDDRSKELIRQAVKYSDNTTRLQRLHILAASDAANGNMDGAKSMLKEIISEFPDDKYAYERLARGHINIVGDLVKGIYYLKEALKIDPGDKLLYNLLAYAYKDMREYDKAIDALDKYIAIAPNEPNPYDSRGEIYAAAGKFDLAVAAYRQALTKDPRFVGSLNALVLIFCHLRDYERADSCAQALINDKEKQARSAGRLYLSYSKLHQGKFEQALQILDEGIAADGLDNSKGFPRYFKYIIRGFINADLGRYEEALKDIREGRLLIVQTGSGDQNDFVIAYAYVLAQSGNISQAISVLDEAMPQVLKTNGKFEEAMIQIGYGKIEMIRNNYEKAIEYYTKAIPIHKRFARPVVEYFLAIAYIKNSQPERAVLFLERYTTQIEFL
ncbi:MAG: protein kinase, partial [candidate division Zixibacteria bacterium]|nr:protein kinase [candidate division Zixibacteria bacterium]